MRATSARRRSATQGRRAERQQLLLDTVERLLADRSFRDLTVEDVMREASLPRTTFYRYFPDLESILLLGVDRLAEELGAASALWWGASTDLDASLEEAGTALVAVYRRHGRMLLAFAEAAATAPAVEAAWQAAIDGFIDANTTRVQDLVDSGRARLPHPAATATALVWMTERFLLETYGRGPGMATTTAVETLVLIWRRTLFGSTAEH